MHLCAFRPPPLHGVSMGLGPVGRTKALSSTLAGGALGVDMTSLVAFDKGQVVGKVPMMLMPVMLLMPTALSCEPCLHRYHKAEISLNLFCGFQ